MKTAVKIIPRGDAEHLLHAAVPPFRKIVDGETAVEELLFNLEAQDDVKRIGDLISMNSDFGTFDSVEGSVQLLLR